MLHRRNCWRRHGSLQSWHTRSGYRQRGRDGCKAVPVLSRSRGRYPCWMDQDRPQEAVRWPAGRTQRDSTRPPQRAHTPAPKHPGRLAFHFHPFPLCFGLFCNLFLGMTKPPQRTYASRQRADTVFLPCPGPTRYAPKRDLAFSEAGGGALPWLQDTPKSSRFQ